MKKHVTFVKLNCDYSVQPSIFELQQVKYMVGKLKCNRYFLRDKSIKTDHNKVIKNFCLGQINYELNFPNTKINKGILVNKSCKKIINNSSIINAPKPQNARVMSKISDGISYFYNLWF